MTRFSNARRFFTVAFTAAALTAGFFATMSPSYAYYGYATHYCERTIRGTVCTS